jgi:cytidylate kinase
MTRRKTVIAVDGPAASGKGTLARRLADHLRMAHLDTGLLYRAVGVLTVAGGACADDAAAATTTARALTSGDLERDDLRSDTAADVASKVAAMAPVREALLAFQRTFATNVPSTASGAILDGRDIGSLVCPDADAKLFVTAAPHVRAARRLKELRERGDSVTRLRVLRDMKERDARDSGRNTAPLKPADDAIFIDTGALDPETAFTVVLDLVEARLFRR